MPSRREKVDCKKSPNWGAVLKENGIRGEYQETTILVKMNLMQGSEKRPP